MLVYLPTTPMVTSPSGWRMRATTWSQTVRSGAREPTPKWRQTWVSRPCSW